MGIIHPLHRIFGRSLSLRSVTYFVRTLPHSARSDHPNLRQIGRIPGPRGVRGFGVRLSHLLSSKLLRDNPRIRRKLGKRSDFYSTLPHSARSDRPDLRQIGRIPGKKGGEVGVRLSHLLPSKLLHDKPRIRRKLGKGSVSSGSLPHFTMLNHRSFPMHIKPLPTHFPGVSHA